MRSVRHWLHQTSQVQIKHTLNQLTEQNRQYLLLLAAYFVVFNILYTLLGLYKNQNWAAFVGMILSRLKIILLRLNNNLLCWMLIRLY